MDLLVYVRKWTATIAEEEKDRLTPVSYLILPWDLSFFMFWKRSLRLLSSCRLSGNHQKRCGMHFPPLGRLKLSPDECTFDHGTDCGGFKHTLLGSWLLSGTPHNSSTYMYNASWWKAGNLSWLKVKSFCMWRFDRLWDALAVYVKLRWGVCNWQG